MLIVKVTRVELIIELEVTLTKTATGFYNFIEMAVVNKVEMFKITKAKYLTQKI